MVTLSLFDWYVIAISWSIVFLILVSFFLYSKRKPPLGSSEMHPSFSKVAGDFVFVWVLIALLFFYIVTVVVKSDILFAVGNVVVELLLIFYIMRNRPKQTSKHSTAAQPP